MISRQSPREIAARDILEEADALLREH
jgi:hypothetical protein